MLLTYQDLLDHALAYAATDATGAATRQHRAAAQAAYNALAIRHGWNYYWTLGRINTDAPYSTGTVEFDLTGGATERRLTLTGGTWPTWAALGYVSLNDGTYGVERRVSSTVLTLAAASSPSEDIAAGSSYSIIRDTYPLPSDFVAMDDVVAGTSGEPVEYIHPRRWATDARHITPSQPRCISLVGSSTTNGALMAVFAPSPDRVYPVDFTYRRRPRPILFEGPMTGLVTVAANGTTVTGEGTAFRAAMVGSILRLGYDNKNRPTGLAGGTPRAHEAVITAYTSPTSVEIDTGPAEAADRVTFAVTDPCDIDEVGMTEYLLRELEMQWRAVSRSSGGPLSTAGAEKIEYDRTFTRAMEADNRHIGRKAALRSRAGGINDPYYPLGVAGEA